MGIEKNEKIDNIKPGSPGACLAKSLAISYDPREYNRLNLEDSDNKPTTTKATDKEPIIQSTLGLMKLSVLLNRTLDNDPLITVSIPEQVIPKPSEKTKRFSDYLSPDTSPSSSSKSNSSSDLTDKLNNLTPEAKIQLAHAVYISQINGDNSLEPNQFMISVNEENQVTSIVRTDHSHTFETTYRSSFLEDDTVAEHVNNLWRQTDSDALIKTVSLRFSQQLRTLDSQQELQQKALLQFSTVYLASN